jgi:hypothetical protein
MRERIPDSLSSDRGVMDSRSGIVYLHTSYGMSLWPAKWNCSRKNVYYAFIAVPDVTTVWTMWSWG